MGDLTVVLGRMASAFERIADQMAMEQVQALPDVELRLDQEKVWNALVAACAEPRIATPALSNKRQEAICEVDRLLNQRSAERRGAESNTKDSAEVRIGENDIEHAG